MVVAVCGTISSGKTTLAKRICKLNNFIYVPQHRQELAFLEEFFLDIPQNFFRTQVSFLVSKTMELKELSQNNIVVDRSLYEDINIFAQLWMDLYPINEKEKTLYMSLSSYLCSTISQPTVYIICRCGWDELQKRYIHRQRRPFEQYYPNGYFEMLYDRYQNISYPSNAYVFEVDTERIDVRLDESAVAIMNYITERLRTDEYEQLSLFDIREGNNRKQEIEEHIRMLQKPQ